MTLRVAIPVPIVEGTAGASTGVSALQRKRTIALSPLNIFGQTIVELQSDVSGAGQWIPIKRFHPGMFQGRNPVVQEVLDAGVDYRAFRFAGTEVVTMSVMAEQDCNCEDALGSEGMGYTKATDDASAATATGRTTFFGNTSASTVVFSNVYYWPDEALAGDNTDYATITIVSSNAAGVLVNSVTKTTRIASPGTGNWSQRVRVDLALLTTLSVPSGGSMDFAIAKTGLGVVVPSGRLQVTT